MSRGSVEVLPLAFLVGVAGTILLADSWAVVDAKLAVEQAAREAGRAYVEAPELDQAPAAARQAAATSFAGSGHDPDRLDLTLTGSPRQRCALVRFDATYVVPVMAVPFVDDDGPTFVVHAAHQELLDPFASDRSGEATCD